MLGSGAAYPVSLSSPTWGWSGKVVSVIDGDSITVLHDPRAEQIRLYGIDCPEKGQDFGNRAKQLTSALVYGKVVEVEPVTVDRYGRTVALLRVGNTLVNEELIRRGLAKPARVVGKEEIVDEPLDPDPARERRGVELAASVRPRARAVSLLPATAIAGACRPLQQHRRGDDGRPDPAGSAFRSLRYARAVDDVPAHAVLLPALVVVLVEVERHAEQRGEHGGGKVLRVVTRLLLRLPVGVVLGKVPVHLLVGGNGDADGRGDAPPWLVRCHLREHDEGHLAGFQGGESLLGACDLASRRENGGDAHDVQVRDAGIPERHFEAVELFFIDPDPPGQEELAGNKSHLFPLLSTRI
jgi:hypothetical protein